MMLAQLLGASPAPNVPDLSGGAAPPGTEKIVTILQWGLWGVSIAAIMGVLYAAGRMAVNYRQHGSGGGEAMAGLVWTLIACVLASAASAIVAALI